ncbi:hypothetical protein [Sporohalobacter salinus]|uniref:hypothetical protein n=1 Tax=Sporohalobacter salinus TaxID=1494606 RepID=UPI001960B413|nr:hypothetical protein [Sporohalobacter salinus]MBM7624121.1 1,4-dihydroxy-2-naphthoate octaprenyltransferase [Sporohalobacter salinus]
MLKIINTLIRDFLAVFFVGMSIKLMDDYLDQIIDKLENKKTLALKWGRATLPYALLFFSLAAVFNYSWTISLFWVSYILGMGYDITDKLPTGIKAYQESLFLLLIAIYVLSIENLLSSLSIIVGIQLIDDLIDIKHDNQVYRNNFVYLLGEQYVIFLLIIVLSIGIYLNIRKTLFVLISTPLIILLLEDKGGRGSKN